MTVPAKALGEKLDAIRDATLTALLEAQASALNAGADIDPEPIRRDGRGAIRRDGPLDLPARGDLAVTAGGRTLIRQVEAPSPPDFAPFPAFNSPDFAAEIHPFAWDRAVLILHSAQTQPAWTTLRHWFLEWFQARPNDLSPELAGAVHSLQGPWQGTDHWRAIADLGSAPIGCVAALIAAIGQTGCARLVIGSE